mmetsp:Transcript_27638/g.41921  ORF Transcript_27638/g.41921 Transcript_27638/m.41921 type:complete len:102 (-) Transcript_27638:936-1241(-)|eukprot:CAMPEP_0170485094 /NCGR_PEP_ID=MMETSP0208-20121228/4427_1 /TAXON_ID=197538 /ORGANISM="Strombidium inclinatum, Strain S3" /LENGTH=101 /DNA_ID=CAMNT_0010758633 /DNA_START=1273 /DNA_END=1578 /DNA_ORIENTATION=-
MDAENPEQAFNNYLKTFYGDDFLVPPHSDSEIDEYDSEVENTVSPAEMEKMKQEKIRRKKLMASAPPDEHLQNSSKIFNLDPENKIILSVFDSGVGIKKKN